MQTKQTKCFKKGLAAASAGASPASAPCCTHCALLWSPNSEPCLHPTCTRGARQGTAVELHPAVPALLPFAPRLQRGRRCRSVPAALAAPAGPFLGASLLPSPPPHCAKCWKRQLQYYCSEVHLLPALDGLAFVSIAVETGASRVTSLGISYRVGFSYRLRYLLYTL